jgi:hypothetical protein
MADVIIAVGNQQRLIESTHITSFVTIDALIGGVAQCLIVPRGN